jgi:hypothetical protein
MRERDSLEPPYCVHNVRQHHLRFLLAFLQARQTIGQMADSFVNCHFLPLLPVERDMDTYQIKVIPRRFQSLSRALRDETWGELSV